MTTRYEEAVNAATHRCFTPDCEAWAVEGTGYCAPCLAARRREIAGASGFPLREEDTEDTDSTDAEREQEGQMILLDTYRRAQREGAA